MSEEHVGRALVVCEEGEWTRGEGKADGRKRRGRRGSKANHERAIAVSSSAIERRRPQLRCPRPVKRALTFTNSNFDAAEYERMWAEKDDVVVHSPALRIPPCAARAKASAALPEADADARAGEVPTGDGATAGEAHEVAGEAAQLAPLSIGLVDSVESEAKAESELHSIFAPSATDVSGAVSPPIARSKAPKPAPPSPRSADQCTMDATEDCDADNVLGVPPVPKPLSLSSPTPCTAPPSRAQNPIITNLALLSAVQPALAFDVELLDLYPQILEHMVAEASLLRSRSPPSPSASPVLCVGYPVPAPASARKQLMSPTRGACARTSRAALHALGSHAHGHQRSRSDGDALLRTFQWI